MVDPMASIAEEAESGAAIAPDGAEVDAPQGPTFGEKVVELFMPCPEDPLAAVGGISRFVNSRLATRSGVPVEQIQVGENLAHCINHLFPGGGSMGWPPIVNLARSVLAYRDAANKHPDNGDLVRR